MQLSRNQRAALNSAAKNRAYMADTGLTHAGDRIWQTSEEDQVRSLWPNVAGIQAALPWRTECAIRKRAQKLRLVKPRRVWSDAEFGQMKPPYTNGEPVPEIAQRLKQKTPKQVYGKASSRRVRRPRKPPKITGIVLADQIRQKAFEEGLTMRDLDALAQARGYFSRPRRLRSLPIRRAMALWGGRLVVSFPDSE